MIKGTELFVKALIEEEVDTIFGYPGGYAIDLFDALYDQDKINVVLPRHEQALIHEAEGYARATGKVGVCLVTSGPGATNLVTGIADASYDSVPLVCFTGQVPTELIGNDAFQEVDIIGVTRSICKYGITVTDRKDLGRIIKEAFYIARSGKPGPVIIDLPKNVVTQMGEEEYPETVSIRGYKPNSGVHIGQLKRALDELSVAKKPIFLIGGGVNIAHAGEQMTTLAEITGIPVISTIMGRGAVATTHPNYIGNIGLHGNYSANMAVSECDVLFSIGTRFNDRITGKISEFAKNAKIIHIDIDSASISRNIKVDIPVVGDAKEAITSMIELIHEGKYQFGGIASEAMKSWYEQIHSWEEEHPLYQTEGQEDKECPGMISRPEAVIQAINEMYEEAILVTDVGQHQMWSTQFLELNHKKKLITSGGLGTMGFGFPAAIGAKIACPDMPVVLINGDGGMQMNIQELATAVSWELPITICIMNNGYLGMVRQMQEIFYHKKYMSTCLRFHKSCLENCPKLGTRSTECPPYTPDFVKLAESYGAKGIRVFDEAGIREAFEQAKNNRKCPTVIEFIINPDNLVMPMVPNGNGLDQMITSDMC